MKNEPQTAIILDTRRAKKDGTYPVKLRVTYRRKQKHYPTPFAFREAEFAEVMKPKPRKKHKEDQLKLQAIETRAYEVLEALPTFSFQRFHKLYTNGRDTIDRNDALAACQQYIDELEAQGSAGTADVYRSGLKSFKKYFDSLCFTDITPDSLKEYEQWMLAKGNSLTTVGIYMRQLRAVFNRAIAEGHVNQELYPFGRRKYEIPTGSNVKKALSLKDIEFIFNYKPESEAEARYRDLWLFSYLANGMNIKDVMRLKYKDIQDGKIVFYRAKTIKTSRGNPKPVAATLTPELEEIVRKWGRDDSSPNNYVFGYLTGDTSPSQEIKIKRQLIKQINKYMRQIGKKIRVEKDITTYTARHSFATVLKRSGAPIEFISESLGHKDLKTTENYLDSFEDDVKKRYAEMLTKFEKDV